MILRTSLQVMILLTSLTSCIMAAAAAAASMSRIEEGFPRLTDEDRISIPKMYQGCFDLIQTITKPGFKFKDAVPLIREQESILMSLYEYEGVIPVNDVFVLKYQQTLRDEFDRLKSLVDPERAFSEEERTPHLKDAYFCMMRYGRRIVGFHKDVIKGDKTATHNLLGFTSETTEFYQTVPQSSPFSPTPLLSKATHKILMMGCIRNVFQEIASMARVEAVEVEPGCSVPIPAFFVKHKAYMDGHYINMERDGDLPFTTVFDQVRDSYGHFDIKCGSRIFDYIKAFIPDMDFRDDLPMGSIPLERLTDYL